MATVRLNQGIREQVVRKLRKQESRRLEKAREKCPIDALRKFVRETPRSEVLKKAAELHSLENSSSAVNRPLKVFENTLEFRGANRNKLLQAITDVQIQVQIPAKEIVKRFPELGSVYASLARATFPGIDDANVQKLLADEKMNEEIILENVSPAFYRAASHYNSRYYELRLSFPIDPNVNPPSLLSLEMEFMDYAKKVFRIKWESQLLFVSIRKILNDCSTLRQVLELWPNALDFMPDHVIKQHNAKAEPKNKKRDLSDLALGDDAKVVLAKARLSNM